MILMVLATFFYSLATLFIILLILIQKGKGGMGLGNIGGTNQVLFGSSGGQDVFQTTTWFLCGFLLVGSFFLSSYKSKYHLSAHSISYKKAMPKQKEELENSSDDSSQV